MSDKIPFSLLNLEYFKALDSSLEPDYNYIERKIRREYCVTFHTPLHDVYLLDFSFVLQNLYEFNLQNKTKDQLKQIVESVIPSVNKELEDRLDREAIEMNERFSKPALEKQSEANKDNIKTPEINMSFPDEELEDL